MNDIMSTNIIAIFITQNIKNVPYSPSYLNRFHAGLAVIGEFGSFYVCVRVGCRSPPPHFKSQRIQNFEMR